MLVFLDTEFTNLSKPRLLSLGLVTLDDPPQEHYAELDLATDIGQARKRVAAEFVTWEVLPQWGLVPDAQATEWEIGRGAGEWLLARATESGGRVELGYDYKTDIELLEETIRDSGIWHRVREVILPVNVGPLTDGIDGELAAEEAWRATTRRGLGRHHALADAYALRAAYAAVKQVVITQMRGSDSARG